jgi:hypothetical protein
MVAILEMHMNPPSKYLSCLAFKSQMDSTSEFIMEVYQVFFPGMYLFIFCMFANKIFFKNEHN